MVKIEVMSQEVVAGLILLKTNSDVKHDGIFLTMEGSVNLQLSSKNVGIFEAFYNSVKVCIFIFSRCKHTVELLGLFLT